MTLRSRLAVLALAAGALLLMPGCDTTGANETIELSGDSPIPPEIEYVFEYAREDVNDGTVVVSATPERSGETPTLDAVLEENGGYTRSDVQAASVEKVVIDDASTTAGLQALPAQPAPDRRVFRYLRQAQISLNGEGGPVVARGEVSDDGPDDLAIASGASDVLAAIQSGSPTRSTLELDVQDPSSVPTRDQGGDKVRVTITYALQLPAP
jgi:hypothetical protein